MTAINGYILSAQGTTGIQGSAGPQGISGTGTVGTQGPTGAQGVTGNTGAGINGYVGMMDFGNGTWISNAFAVSSLGLTLTVAANRWYSIPFMFNKDTNYSSLGFYVTSGVTNAKAVITIYSDNYAKPNSLLYTSPQINCSTAGLKEITTSGTFYSGQIYWLTFVANSNPRIAVTDALTTITFNYARIGGYSLLNGYYKSYSSNLVPSATFGNVTNLSTSNLPIIGIKLT